MKRNLLIWLTCLFYFTACNNDDTPIPNTSVLEAFNIKYPTASLIKWENKNPYITAEFVDNNQAHTAWFDTQGQWYMTETELKDITQLPPDVLTAFQSSPYATWTTDDIDCLERSDAETIYVIEVKKGNQEYDLHYSTDGILLQAVPDNDTDDYEEYLPDPTALPAALQEFITKQYPGARIVDTEKKHSQTEVDIIHEKKSKEVVFDTQNQWINTHYDVLKNEVENNVLQALNQSEYANYTIDDIEKYETANGYYYLFELEKGEMEIELQIDTKGQITLINK